MPDAYDAVPYPSDALDQTHPDRLATLGRLFGLTTVAPSGCRYLELGCGSGMNLLGMAATLPGSRFVGIDLAAGPIAQAKRDAGELGLPNIEFSQGDITDLAEQESLGEFDYIVAHGVYSWVPPAVRSALLRLCQRHLAPHGIAYISYNTLPGGHIRQMVRGMMRYHVRDIDSVDERLEQGRALLNFLLEAKAGPEIYAPLLERELAHLNEAEPGLVHHDDFAPVNQPFYLHEFLAEAQAHELQFVAEAVLQEMQVHSFTRSVRETLMQMDSDVAMREQYIDFLKCRRFRQTLLCHRARMLERSTAPLQALPHLLLASDAQPKPVDPGHDATQMSHMSFLRKGRAGLTTTSQAVQVALKELNARWPHAVDFTELLALLQSHPEFAQASEETVTPVIWHLAEIGMLDLRCEAVPCVAAVSLRPRASRLARWQITRSRKVTSQSHVMVRLEGELLAALLPLLDGSRTIDDLCTQISALLHQGTISPAQPLNLAEADAVHQVATQAVLQALEKLRSLALLEA